MDPLFLFFNNTILNCYFLKLLVDSIISTNNSFIQIMDLNNQLIYSFLIISCISDNHPFILNLLNQLYIDPIFILYSIIERVHFLIILIVLVIIIEMVHSLNFILELVTIFIPIHHLTPHLFMLHIPDHLGLCHLLLIQIFQLII